ncbi:class I SAM-dependent methyltransferase [Nocardia carnea]|uniref:class I SAM-dependent methyltransferase n=1 Tax=Nocardia carnea TaxID=37328 RepID=UPI0020D029FE|nr:class I SAM-dependent methyltransferase [Nocardia carnea]
MTSDQHTRSPMFVDAPDTGLVIEGMRRYNLFTTVWFLGRHRRLLAELVRASGAQPGDDAADIGCGPGKLVRALGAQVGPRGSVAGIDPSATAIDYNHRRDTRPNHRYLAAPAQELPLPDASVDVVTCTFVMHHIPEEYREPAIAEMWRVLRPGAGCCLPTPGKPRGCGSCSAGQRVGTRAPTHSRKSISGATPQPCSRWVSLESSTGKAVT